MDAWSRQVAGWLTLTARNAKRSLECINGFSHDPNRLSFGSQREWSSTEHETSSRIQMILRRRAITCVTSKGTLIPSVLGAFAGP